MNNKLLNADNFLQNAIEKKTTEATIFYTDDNALGINQYTDRFLQTPSGRIIIPSALKAGKTILLVCEGNVKVLNRYGERLGIDHKEILSARSTNGKTQ